MEVMEQQDHSYTNSMCDQISPADFTYKMSNKEIEDFVKLRMSNSDLFSGKKNSSRSAWRAILKHMGLHFKMTHRQAAKKWDNMKKKYKKLKYPPEGLRVVPEAWPFFSLMDDAMEGRLRGRAPIVETFPHSSDNSDFLLTSIPKKRRVLNLKVSSSTDLICSEPEIEISMNGDEDEDEEDREDVVALGGREEINCIIPEVEVGKDKESYMTKREQLLVERERTVLDREITALERERALLEKERAAMERERVTMERERAVMERERAVMERERAVMEKDREALHRERQALDKEKAKWERFFEQNEKTKETREDGNKVMNPDSVDRTG